MTDYLFLCVGFGCMIQGFGFVTFESSIDANRARQVMDGRVLEGRCLEVKHRLL